MIIRLTQPLGDRIGVKAVSHAPLHVNPYLDWTGDIFSAGRDNYILLTNTASLYSTLMHGRGVVNENLFITHALQGLKEMTMRDDIGFIYQRLIAPDAKIVRYVRNGDKILLAGMNDIARQAKYWIEQKRLSLPEIAARLNESAAPLPNRPIPAEAFRAQHVKTLPEQDETLEET